MRAKAMMVAGIMSGTSADGIDVALVRIARGTRQPTLTLLAHEGFRFPAALRRAVLGAMNATATSTAELARLNWRLGTGLCGCGEDGDCAEQSEGRSDWMPRADNLSPGAGNFIRRPELRLHVATRRGGGHRGQTQRAGGVEFQSGGYGGWRTGSTAGAAARLRDVRACETWARAAEHRRHRESHRYSCGRRGTRN